MRRTPAHPAARAVPPCIAAVAVAMIVLMTARTGGPADRPDGPPPGPGAPLGPATLVDAVNATREVANARVELTATLPGPSGPVTLSHRGAFLDGGLRASAESDMSQAAAALGAAGEQLEGDWSHPARVVVTGGTVYSQLGPMAASLGRQPEDWARAGLEDLVATGAAADNDTLALALDPLGPLDLLARPVVEIGEVPGGDDADAQVRGAPARHLRASLDLVTGAGGGPAEGSFEARLVESGVEALPVDVWLDADGIVRRLVVTVDAARGLTTTFEIYDVGEVGEGDVAAPDPAEVIPTASPPAGDADG